MNFLDRFKDASPFQEVLEMLFRNIENAPCACCETLTPFLDYAGVGPGTWDLHYAIVRAIPVCSEECMIALAEKKTGKPLGKPDDYRLLEGG